MYCILPQNLFPKSLSFPFKYCCTVLMKCTQNYISAPETIENATSDGTIFMFFLHESEYKPYGLNEKVMTKMMTETSNITDVFGIKICLNSLSLIKYSSERPGASG